MHQIVEQNIPKQINRGLKKEELLHSRDGKKEFDTTPQKEGEEEYGKRTLQIRPVQKRSKSFKCFSYGHPRVRCSEVSKYNIQNF